MVSSLTSFRKIDSIRTSIGNGRCNQNIKKETHLTGINKEPSYKAYYADNQRNNARSIDNDAARDHPLEIEGLHEGNMCEAVNCFSLATGQLEVKVGHLGNISLSLCNDCVSKFRDET
jgi:hypothetical protein